MSETTTETPQEASVGPQEDGNVGVKLAHPLSKSALRRLFLPEDTVAHVGAVVVVRPDQAQSLIGAGMVQINPRDRVGVKAILHGEEKADVEPSATSGNTVPGAGEGYDTLTGKALDDALTKRGLPKDGSADEKRAAVQAYDAEHPDGV